MGCGWSSESRIHTGNRKGDTRRRILAKLDSDVDRILAEAHAKTPQRALFLGTGESGKSTVFKQLRINYGDSFTSFERYQYSKLIWIETLRAIRVLIDKCEALGETSWFRSAEGASVHVAQCKQLIQSLDLSRRALLAAETNNEVREFLNAYSISQAPLPITASNTQGNASTAKASRPTVIRTPSTRSLNGSSSTPVSPTNSDLYPLFRDDAEITMEPVADAPENIVASRHAIARAVDTLWEACPVHVRAMVEANQMGMETNAAYFLDRVMDLMDPTYMARDSDIVHARIKTTGIVTAEFNVKGSDLLVMDVGGQRVERRKWIYSFDDVTTLLFVVAVSEFDQVLVEDERINRLEEALTVFEQTVNSQWFRAKSVTLFFNKTDVLERKVQTARFSDYFPGFEGEDTNADHVLDHIEKMFRQRLKSHGRNMYTHRTCATDTTSMRFVVEAVTDMILYENLKWAGMI